MESSGGLKEAAFYNALNISTNSGYKALRREYLRHGSWEKCWLRSGQRNMDPRREWKSLQERGIGLVLADEPGYPPLLAEISDPPFGIYFKGSLSAAGAEPAVAVVGTRKASAMGKDLSKKFGAALAAAGCSIVSGLAFGIDAAAHAGAIEAGGLSVAVLASGLDKVYPASNHRLANDIIKSGGALVSEYPIGSPPLAYRFLERNRIISGLSRAVLAIEVPERSGVLATARFALDQNRDIFVVPGPTSHPNYQGSHRLIRAGATLVTGPRDLLEDMGFQELPSVQTVLSATPEEERVLETMRSAGRPLTIDEIIEAATLTSSMANQAMTMLVLRNAVREEDNKYTLR